MGSGEGCVCVSVCVSLLAWSPDLELLGVSISP